MATGTAYSSCLAVRSRTDDKDMARLLLAPTNQHPPAAAVVVNGVRTKCGAVHNNNSAAEQVRVVDKGC